MLKTGLLVVAVFLASAFVYSCNRTKKEAELPKLIKEGAILVDVRTQDEFAEGSVTGAVNIPLDVLQDSIGKLKTDKHIIVFCKSGNRAGKAKKLLEEHNITDVTNGGSWQDVKTALENTNTEAEPAEKNEK